MTAFSHTDNRLPASETTASGAFLQRHRRKGLAEDARFADNAARSRNRADLKPLLEAKLAGFECDALCDTLLRQGVPAGPVNAIPEVFTHPHTLHRGMRASVKGDEWEAPGIAAKLSRTPGAVRTAPPRFGNATREVLVETGYTATEVESLTKPASR